MPSASPPAPTLQDFEPLLLAELILLRAAADGTIAKIGYRRPRTATPDVRLRAEFLAFLAQGGGAGAPVAGHRLQVLGACIIGRLDLRGATVPASLWFYRCVFGAAPFFDGAHIRGSLSFADSGLPGLTADACRIDGELALNAGCSVHGEMRLVRAVIGRDLNGERLQLRPSEKFTHTLPCRIVADGLQVGGDVLLTGGVATTGTVSFEGAQIAGDLRATDAHMSAELEPGGARGIALNLDRAVIHGHLVLNDGFSAAGQLNARRVRIGGDLDATGAEFDAIGDAGWGDAAAVRLDRARIGGALILRHLRAPLQGASLADARAGSLCDDASTWGQHHVLDGFSYARLGAGSPTDAHTRVRWLARQRASHLSDDFRPGPWQRLASVLRRSGHVHAAGDVAIASERQRRRAGVVGAGVMPAWRWLPRAGHAVFGVLAGHGHRPLRLAALAAVLWLLGGATGEWAAGQGLMAPGEPGAPPFHAFAYSLDLLVPGLDLGQAQHWAPTSGLLRAFGWLQALAGWLIALALLACATGWAGHDRSA